MESSKRAKLIEKGPGFKAGLKSFISSLSAESFFAGLIAAIFGCTGPALVVIGAGQAAGYSSADIATWLFGIYVFGGTLGILISLYFKQPIAGAFTIPGAAMLASNLVGIPFEEAAGAFIMAGIIVLIMGVTGVIGKIMRWIPIPIVMAMIAGAMIHFGTGIIKNVFVYDEAGMMDINSLIIGLATLAGFFILPKFIKKFPPVVGALVFGVVAMMAVGIKIDTGDVTYIAPRLVTPTFSSRSFFSVSLTLAALVIGAENSQAIGVLMVQGYKPPINVMTIASGIGGIVSGLFGAHNANIAGPMTAICASEEAGDKKEDRYTASVVCGIFFAAFGLVSSLAMGMVASLPKELIGILAGLGMINVLIQALEIGFGTKKFQKGVFFALITAMSGIKLFGIGAAFWALIFGVIISLLTEKQDFHDN